MSKASEPSTEVELRSPGRGATPEDPTGNGWYCGAKQKQPKPHWPWCTHRAGHGTDHKGVGSCKFHGGSTPNGKKHAQVEVIRRTAESLGIVPEHGVDPGEQILELVAEAAGNCEFYRRLVAELPTHPTRGQMVDGDEGERWEPGVTGIYGPTYHQSGIPTGEAKPHVLVTMYDAERDRLAGFITAALKAGVEERRVRLAERDATMLFGAVARALERMGLTKRFEEFRVEFARALDEQPAALGAPGAG